MYEICIVISIGTKQQQMVSYHVCMSLGLSLIKHVELGFIVRGKTIFLLKVTATHGQN